MEVDSGGEEDRDKESTKKGNKVRLAQHSERNCERDLNLGHRGLLGPPAGMRGLGTRRRRALPLPGRGWLNGKWRRMRGRNRWER
ncbi:hypothetical protein LIER_08541 [Lithospermum erythrorhizon]|uniref:Uncharacterized protein n=1 Tax=Lithospermum erythrorhizon TaxID=34254 RepID=A0AAV3PDZ4_LITER